LDETKFNHLADKFQRIFDTERLNELGRETEFLERVRKYTPARLIPAIVATLATTPVVFLTRFWRNFNQLCWEARGDYSTFHRKLKQPEFADLMRAFCQHLIEVAVLRVAKPIKPKLRRFDDIVIHDGTSLTLKAAEPLIDQFPGRWKHKAPAAAQLHVTMSLYTDQLRRICLTPDRPHESRFAPAAEQLGDQLFLADAAFNSLDYHAAIDEAGGWYLIRVRHDSNPVVRTCLVDGTRREELEGHKLQEIVDQLEGHRLDLSVEWIRQGTSNVRGRLILWPIPPDERDEDKPEVTHMYLATNLGREAFQPREIRQLYRLRWQVELLIRDLKSGAHLSAYQTKKPPLAEGLIWASIAAAMLQRFLAHVTQQLYRLVEISTESTSRALQMFLPECIRLFIHGDQWRSTFERIVRHLSEVAPRTHPERDRKKGRAAPGIWPMPP